MSITFPSTLTRRSYTWTQWKAVYTTKGSLFQYEDDGTLYTIWTYDGPEIHTCQIWKDLVPIVETAFYSQDQNNADKADFENNYKAYGNQPLYQLDTDGAQIVRHKAAKKGWSFWSVPIEITTSTIGGDLYCKDASGADVPGLVCKIYDNENAEITEPGALNANLATCVKTVVDFEPAFDYEVVGGMLRTNSNQSQDVRLWIVGAPDIPAQYGGSKEFASGINLKFVAADGEISVDGRVTKFIKYNPNTHSGKLRILLKHPAGLQVNMQFVIQVYRQ